LTSLRSLFYAAPPEVRPGKGPTHCTGPPPLRRPVVLPVSTRRRGSSANLAALPRLAMGVVPRCGESRSAPLIRLAKPKPLEAAAQGPRGSAPEISEDHADFLTPDAGGRVRRAMPPFKSQRRYGRESRTQPCCQRGKPAFQKARSPTERERGNLAPGERPLLAAVSPPAVSEPPSHRASKRQTPAQDSARLSGVPKHSTATGA
jgi:hypothetical protein